MNENDRPVTEDDLRLPEFRGVNPEDLERRRSDGKVVRKDRWEKAVWKIASALGMTDSREGFEIDDVVALVERMSGSEGAMDGSPAIWWGHLETANFTFDVFGPSLAEMPSLLEEAWQKHCEQTGASPEMYEELAEELSCARVCSGMVLRDREPFFKKKDEG